MIKDILLDWILFTFWEGLICINFIVRYDIIKKHPYKFVVSYSCFSICLSLMYYYGSQINFPLFTQLLFFISVIVYCKIMFHVNMKASFMKLLLIYGIMFMCDSAMMFIWLDIFNLAILDNVLYTALGLIPSKLIEFFISYKGSDIIMKFTWGSIERR